MTVTAVEPAGIDVGVIEVITRATGGGVCVVPPPEAAGLELPQPETKRTADRHTKAETQTEDKQDFMIANSIPIKDYLRVRFFQPKEGSRSKRPFSKTLLLVVTDHLLIDARGSRHVSGAVLARNIT